MVREMKLIDYVNIVLNPTMLRHIQNGAFDNAIVNLPIEIIYDLCDNDVKNSVLDRLKVIDGMDLPRIVGNAK